MEKPSKLVVSVSILEEKQAAVVTLDGEVDPLTIGRVESAVTPLLEKGYSLIVDCEKLSYISSIGLVALLRYDSRVKEKGCKFFLVSPSQHVNELLSVVGAHELLTVYDTLDQAKAEL